MALGEKTMGEIWLKMEPFILHIGTDSLENSRRILATMYKAGVKRGGILVAKEGKFIVELQGTQEMSIPLKQGGKILVDDDFLRYAVKRANEKMGKNDTMLRRFEEECRKAML
jgi:tRNA(Phe) wybutosine-synthesizing methylase Tyw3